MADKTIIVPAAADVVLSVRYLFGRHSGAQMVRLGVNTEQELVGVQTICPNLGGGRRFPPSPVRVASSRPLLGSPRVVVGNIKHPSTDSAKLWCLRKAVHTRPLTITRIASNNKGSESTTRKSFSIGIKLHFRTHSFTFITEERELGLLLWPSNGRMSVNLKQFSI